MLSRQALTQEALRAQKEAEQKIKEAQSNMEEAQKLVDAAKQEEERLKAQLNIGMRVTIDNLATHPGGGPQRVANGDGGAGNEPQHPQAGPPHVPALAPIIITTPRVNPIPNPDPTQMSQVEKANVLREAERQKANDDFEALAEARAREEAPYVEANDFSFLREYPKLNKNNETNTKLPMQKSAARVKDCAPRSGGGCRYAHLPWAEAYRTFREVEKHDRKRSSTVYQRGMQIK